MADISHEFYLSFNEPPIIFMNALEADDLVFSLQCKSKDGVIRTIRGHKCATAADLHNEVAAVLQFPDYYGENWDAMDECITDLEWLPGSWYLINLCRVQSVLPDDERNFKIFMSILLDAGRTWANPSYRGMSSEHPSKPFNIIISGNEPGISRAKRAIGMLLEKGR